jgi:hypothetical protein
MLFQKRYERAMIRRKFADWTFNYHRQFQDCTHHAVTNHLCELKGDPELLST